MKIESQLTPEDIYYFSKLSQLGIEEWKDVPGFNGAYEVSNLGRVKSNKTNQILTGTITNAGHTRYMLTCGTQRRPSYGHLLVMISFNGERPSGKVIRHKNGKASDNRLHNLIYGTQMENVEDMIAAGDNAKGQSHGRSKLKELAIKLIRKFHSIGMPRKRIAHHFKISKEHVTAIVSRRYWKHIY